MVGGDVCCGSCGFLFALDLIGLCFLRFVDAVLVLLWLVVFGL